VKMTMRGERFIKLPLADFSEMGGRKHSK